VPTFADRGVPRGQRDGSLRPDSRFLDRRMRERLLNIELNKLNKIMRIQSQYSRAPVRDINMGTSRVLISQLRCSIYVTDPRPVQSVSVNWDIVEQPFGTV
jgi:hypothetical protein